MHNAGVQNVTAAQVNAVVARAPAAVIAGGGNPVHGLQQAVAGRTASPSPRSTRSLRRPGIQQQRLASHNDVVSNNDPHMLSPEAGHDVQQGGFNLAFGDITLGNKNTASDGSVINTGHADNIDNTNVHGHGNVVGDGNVGANTGDILAGEGSTVQAGGVGNTSDSHGSTTIPTAVAAMSSPETRARSSRPEHRHQRRQAAGGASGRGGILGGGGAGGAANAGGGGQVVIAPTQTTTTDTHGGDVTAVNTHGGHIHGNVDASHHDDNSVHTDNSTRTATTTTRCTPTIRCTTATTPLWTPTSMPASPRSDREITQ